MSRMTRRSFSVASLAGIVGTVFGIKPALADNNQGVGTELQIVSTGNVSTTQSVAAGQNVNGAGVGNNGQTVVTSGQIVSTGNVVVGQSVSAAQDVSGGTPEAQGVSDPYYPDGRGCNPGDYGVNDAGQVCFCTSDCAFVCVECPKRGRCCG